MATEPTNSPTPPPAPAPPSPPGPGASRNEWRAWRHQQRDYMHSQGGPGGWYGPWGWGWGGMWGWWWGGALVLIGVYYLLYNVGALTWLKGDVLWPILLILLGVALLLRRGRGWWH